MASYLVTGGAGFIGSNIVEKLVIDGHKVRVVDNLATGKIENINDFINDIEFIKGDLADFIVAKRAVEKMEYIIHQAAIPSVPFSIENPIKANESMVTATVNLFKAAVESGCTKRIVQAVSAAAYGNNPKLPKQEDMLPEPVSPYAAAKLMQEYYARAFYSSYDLEIVSLRYFNVFGPKQDPKSPYSGVVSIFLSKMLRGERPTIFGDGSTSRDFVFVEDIVTANLQALLCKWTGNSEVINIGRGESISLNELVMLFNDILEVNIEPLYESERIGDIKHSIADISKAERILGFKPSESLKYGLRKLILWYKMNMDQDSKVKASC
ncbi:SDR family oxidoreductase [Pseudobacteroides cellulosolvens]|uniref:UDP-glucose 4-epimerase n=1 Tax=Pseudobacteroides cellulosolvens ATCC 35603 = DSM 2933 TaxID=398512 RepID=A0A0L6JM43_9FIRM|nr:SDR family oxidoreductase [Pseudobacteroides cellulosolvens]KNY26823.1 UDP-glucose 4-epimerase [Pseudobacteroides cellulosolvens ATCC 35603 = DSM 2933]